jgi:hypothetical protein
MQAREATKRSDNGRPQFGGPPGIDLLLRGALTGLGALADRLVKPQDDGSLGSPPAASITIYTGRRAKAESRRGAGAKARRS